MARTTGRLTDLQLKAWIRAGDPVAKSDGQGLNFTLSKSGTAAWTLRYRFAGKAAELTFGRYPDIGIAKARELASEARVKVGQGVNPGREKLDAKRQRIAALTFKELADDYIAKVLPTLASNTQKQQRHHIKLANNRLGTLPAREVQSSDVNDLIRKVGAKSYTVADAVLSAVRAVFSHGIALDAIQTNPSQMTRIGPLLGPAPTVRERLMLSEKELRDVLPALPTIGDENALAVKILLATCIRTGELAKARWEHVDFDGTAKWKQPNGDPIDIPHPKWLIPIENQKTGKTSGRHFIVPLLPEVVGWFKALKPFAGISPFVLPARQNRRRKTYGGEMYYEPRSLNAMLHKLADSHPDKFRRFTPHDLRSTARSHLAALGTDPMVAERCLNHSLGGLVAIYDRHDYWNERTRALTVWTDFLSACETGQPWQPAANVIRLYAA